MTAYDISKLKIPKDAKQTLDWLLAGYQLYSTINMGKDYGKSNDLIHGTGTVKLPIVETDELPNEAKRFEVNSLFENIK